MADKRALYFFLAYQFLPLTLKVIIVKRANELLVITLEVFLTQNMLAEFIHLNHKVRD